jgi:hypothetical protein
MVSGLMRHNKIILVKISLLFILLFSLLSVAAYTGFNKKISLEIPTGTWAFFFVLILIIGFVIVGVSFFYLWLHRNDNEIFGFRSETNAI